MKDTAKHIELLNEFLAETSSEEINKIIQQLDDVEFDSPSLEDYFGSFEEHFSVIKCFEAPIAQYGSIWHQLIHTYHTENMVEVYNWTAKKVEPDNEVIGIYNEDLYTYGNAA